MEGNEDILEKQDKNESFRNVYKGTHEDSLEKQRINIGSTLENFKCEW